MDESSGFIREKRWSIAITLLVVAVVSIAYFTVGARDEGMGMAGGKEIDAGFLGGISIKVGYTDTGDLKLLAFAGNNEMAKLRASEGNPIPESDTMVLGYAEAMMMRSEGLIESPGDTLRNFFGVRTSVEGILEKTGTPIDEMHFFSAEQYRLVRGEEGRVFIAFNEGVPKLFYSMESLKEAPQKFRLSSGEGSGYGRHIIGETEYIPLVLGSDEAKMMIDEGLFSKPGDTIRGFFGKDVIIAGVLEKTNSSLDMMHFIPLDAEDIGEEYKRIETK